MFGSIQNELEKMVAQAIYAAAKTHGAAALDALKQTDLKKAGKGLPPPILVEFEKSFLAALGARIFSRDGYAKYPAKSGEQEFDFLLQALLVKRIALTNWAIPAKKTADGVKQVAALGGDSQYQSAVASCIGVLFDRAIKTSVGTFHGKKGASGWCVLTDVLTVEAAPEHKMEFRETRLFYWSCGKEEVTSKAYKLSKSAIFKGWIFKGLAKPSAGPYLK